MNPSESFSQSQEDPLDEAFRAVRGRDVPPRPPESLVARSKAAVRQLAQGNLASARGPDDVRRSSRRARYWAIALATSAALLIAVISLPRTTSAALFGKAMEKFSRFTTLKMKVVRLADGKPFDEGMLYFRGNTWSHFAKNHGRRGDPDQTAVPFLGAAINDLDKLKFLSIDYSTRTYSWMEDFKPEKPIPSRLANFASSMDKVVKHLGRETIGDTQTEVYEAKVDELLGRLTEAKVTVWVDPRSELPVQIRSEETFKGPDGARVETTEYRDIVWNPELEERFFSLVPPAGFKQTPPRYVVPFDPNEPPPPDQDGGG
jgi:hypothetical protein